MSTDVKKIPINSLAPLMGGDLVHFFQAFENWRHDMLHDNADGMMNEFIHLTNRIHQECVDLVEERGGFETAHMDLSDFGRIQDKFMLTPNLPQALHHVEALMHGLLLVKQGKFDLYLEEKRKFIWQGAPDGIEQSAYDFMATLESFNRRLHKTPLDQLERVRIDVARANYFNCVTAKYPDAPDSVVREMFWRELQGRADIHRMPFQQAAQYYPRHFTEYSPLPVKNQPKLRIN